MQEHIVPLRVYFVVFFALMILTGSTIAAAFVDLGPLNNVIMLSIAVAKALLVALYFMHLRYSSRLTSVFAAGAILWLFILISLTMSDYLTRSWFPTPTGPA
jgi:cytochrome c oxidase subunit 4